MSFFEQNMEVIKLVRPELFEGLQKETEDEEQVFVGDALDEEKFLAVLRGEDIVALNSTYHPTHEAIRYTAQFAMEADDSVVLLFGFSNGLIPEQMMGEDCPVARCIVYEPSVNIFKKALEEYDLTNVLSDIRITILVEGINGNQLELVLDDKVNFRTWRHFKFRKLSMYSELFPTQLKEVAVIYKRIYKNKSADMNTLIQFAKVSIENEIKALKWMIDSRTFSGMKGHFPTDMPCIVVAAGPSLEKNVEVLRQAKGKAFIMCVDTAIPFLMSRGIVPDLICTVDPIKGVHHFQEPGVKDIPIVISPDSSCAPLEMLGDITPIYVSITNDFYQQLYQKKGYEIGYFDGGGSVATVCFQMGVELGFETIILIGQDLAFSDDKAHAGKGMMKDSDMKSRILMVDAYNGGKILTRADFKYYIDWYNMKLPELKNVNVINATEGGAKLNGATQMTFQAAVDQYCTKEYDIEKMFEETPKVWDTYEEKKEFYEEIKQKYRYFVGFHRRLKDGIAQTDRAIQLIKRGNYQTKELKKIDKQLNAITREVETQDGMVILVKRMIETEITLADDLNDANENLELESIRLYEKMRKYISDLYEAADEMLPFWEATMKEINEKYHFE